MRLAILSDIHANLEALTTAMQAAEAQGADRLVCLGDVVGYGPCPAECIEIVRSEFAVCVRGNHDAAVATGEDIEALPRDGQAAARYHREVLAAEDVDWLASLPLVETLDDATFVHAGPEEPASWPRLESFGAVRAQFGAFDTPLCFVGHSHKPAVQCESFGVFRVRPGHRFLVDVGSVGQPRDHDPRLCFAMYDTEAVTVEHVREHYDYTKTAAQIKKAGLPEGLGARLRKGL